MTNRTVAAALTAIALLVQFAPAALAQTGRHVRVLLNSQQTENVDRDGVQASGGVVIRRGTVSPSGRIVAGDSRTTVQRTSGIFTLVLDGSESILNVATRVPQQHVNYYYNHALGLGYLQRHIVFTDVGTSLRVHAAVLPDGQIKLRLTPRISYFSAERPGAIDFTEAATELIVPNGQMVSLGGATNRLHEITRQILGYSNRSSSSESELRVTATIQ